MSAIKINSKLSEIDSNLDKIDSAVKEGKRKIADAIRFNDIVEVLPNDSSTNDFETFSRYAELIMSIKTRTSPMKLVFKVDHTLVGNGFSWTERTMREGSQSTDLKRTVMLPIPYVQNNIDKLRSIIIDNDKGTYTTETSSAKKRATKKSTKKASSKKQYDPFGNEITLSSEIVMPNPDDVYQFLSTSEIQEYENARKRNTIKRASVSTAFNAKDYIVDWGDGTTSRRDSTKNEEDNLDAIYHTYEKEGTYMVKIYGYFPRLVTNELGGRSQSYKDGKPFLDKDGTYLIFQENLSTHWYLTEVRSWGYTRLTDITAAFMYCTNLTKLPSDLSLSPFKNVEWASRAFQFCSYLKEIPFDKNLNIGLFSNCSKIGSFYQIFGYCYALSESIPDKLFDGCTACYSVNGAFMECRNLKGGLNSDGTYYIPQIFKGMTSLTDVATCFQGCYGLNGCDITNSQLFKDCYNLLYLDSLFYNISLTGTLRKDFFPIPVDEDGNEIPDEPCSISTASYLFRNSAISEIEDNCFEHLKKIKGSTKTLNMQGMFEYCGSLKKVPQDLFAGFERSVNITNMFRECSKLEAIPNLDGFFASSARQVFANCSSATSCGSVENSDWSTYNYIKKWYGCFTGCSKLENFNKIPLELGGDGNRRFREGKVGSIVLKDRTLVDPNDFVFDSSNVPIGIVYLDEYVDNDVKFEKGTIFYNGNKGNVTWDTSANVTHLIHAQTFGQTNKPYEVWYEGYHNWMTNQYRTYNQPNCKNYNFSKNSDGTQTFNVDARINGYNQTKEIRRFVFEAGYDDDCGSKNWDDTYVYKTPKDEGFSSYKIISSLDDSTAIDSSVLYYKQEDDLNYKSYFYNGSSLEEISKYDRNIMTFQPQNWPLISYINNYTLDGTEETKGEVFIPDLFDLTRILECCNWFKSILNKIGKQWNFNGNSATVATVPEYGTWWTSAYQSEKWMFWVRFDLYTYAENMGNWFNTKPVFRVNI